jgi:glucose/arabinose dehydrogenase
MEHEEGRAAIHAIDLAAGTSRLFATGLRNPVGLAFHPDSGALWTTVNERDELGSDLVPDYMTTVQENGFYGWPYSYYGDHLDPRANPQRPDLVAKAIVPDYALGPHTASLGLAFYDGPLFPERYRGGAFLVDREHQHLFITRVRLELNLFEIEHDVGDIFHDAFNGREFVHRAVHLDGGDGRAFQRAEQHPAQRVADSVAVTSFKRFRHELGVSFRRR